MRHTLLPLNERIILRREYRVRVVIVACFMLSLAGLLGISIIFPVYVSTAVEKHRQERVLESLEKESKDSGLAVLQQSVAKSQALLDQLSTEKPEVKISDIVKSLVEMRGELTFNSITVARASTTTMTMTIRGHAPTRDSLLSFKSRFESSIPGNSVDLPVSELAKSTNILFTLKLTQKLP